MTTIQLPQRTARPFGIPANLTGLTLSRTAAHLKRMVNRLPAMVTVAMLLSGCNGRSSSPNLPGAPTSTATYTVSGVVTEMTSAGAAPVAGVRVEVLSAPTFATTDENGFYILSGVSATNNAVSVSKAGYVTDRKTVTISGDTRLDIRVERLVSYVLSGRVFEVIAAGQVPIEGVELYCDGCGSPVGHTFVHTDADGWYSFSWTFNGLNPLFVTKAGYAIVDPTGTLLDREGRVKVTVNGDTRFDVQLVRR